MFTAHEFFIDQSRCRLKLIGNHKKDLSPTTGDCNWENNRNLLRARRKRLEQWREKL
jgi:hypothetical protein